MVFTEAEYTFNDIVTSISELGIKKGDAIFSHNNIGFFGKLKGAKSKKDYYQAFKEAIFKVIGSEGTLIVPTFSYSFFNKQTFDVNNTPGVCGFLSEMVRTDPDSIRSPEANFSIAAIGKEAVYFTQNPPEYSFGIDSFWDRFFSKFGIFCNFNFDAGSTFIHYAEKSLNVPYRYNKPFSGVLIDADGKRREKRFFHYVYDLEIPEHQASFEYFSYLVFQRKISKRSNLGKGQIVMITAKDTMDFIREQSQIEPLFLTKGGNFLK